MVAECGLCDSVVVEPDLVEDDLAAAAAVFASPAVVFVAPVDVAVAAAATNEFALVSAISCVVGGSMLLSSRLDLGWHAAEQC